MEISGTRDGVTVIKAYAKVNIGLRVLSKRPDGYHDIDSFFLLVPLYDEVSISSSVSTERKVTVTGNEGYLEEGKVDLMEKAALAYMKEASISLSVDINIKKHIPSKAGLGGGSSDAAAVLLHLESLYHVLGDGLMALGARLGADIPFFLSGHRLARVGGIGDRIEPRDVCSLGYSWITFYRKDSKGVSTKEAYETIDSIRGRGGKLQEIRGKISRRHFPNDFELVGELPVLDYLGEKYSGKEFYSLSGSGDVAYVLSDSRIEDDDPSFLSSMPLAL